MRKLGLNANSSDVVVSVVCQKLHGEQLLAENVDLCTQLDRVWLDTDYGDLMNTTFALIPAGRSPATYRLGEALSAGAIPVFIHNDFVKPFPNRIPWRLCSFSFPVEEAPYIIETLRAVPQEKLTAMQVKDKRAKNDTGGSKHGGASRASVCLQAVSIACGTWKRFPTTEYFFTDQGG